MSEAARPLEPGHVEEDLSRLQLAIKEDLGAYELASANQRVVAFIIDGMISTALTSVFSAGVTAVTHVSRGNGQLAWMSMVVSAMYYIFPEYSHGQTLGKKIMKIRVLPDSGGELMSFGQVVGRETLGRLASALPLCLGYLGASRRKDHKTFHDRIFHTHVVKVR